jgi:hypothetical protein
MTEAELSRQFILHVTPCPYGLVVVSDSGRARAVEVVQSGSYRAMWAGPPENDLPLGLGRDPLPIAPSAEPQDYPIGLSGVGLTWQFARRA